MHYLILLIKNKCNRLWLKAAGLILFFVLAGSLIASQSGLTEQLARIFYWPENYELGQRAKNIGQVAGEQTECLAVVDELDGSTIYGKQVGGFFTSTSWLPNKGDLVYGQTGSDDHITYSLCNSVNSGSVEFRISNLKPENLTNMTYGLIGIYDRSQISGLYGNDANPNRIMIDIYGEAKGNGLYLGKLHFRANVNNVSGKNDDTDLINDEVPQAFEDKYVLNNWQLYPHVFKIEWGAGADQRQIIFTIDNKVVETWDYGAIKKNGVANTVNFTWKPEDIEVRLGSNTAYPGVPYLKYDYIKSNLQNVLPPEPPTTGSEELIKIDKNARNPSVDVDSQGNLHIAYDCACSMHEKGVMCGKLCYAKVSSINGTIKVDKIFDINKPVSTKRTEDVNNIFLADSDLKVDRNDNVHLSWNWGYGVIKPDGTLIKKENLFPVVEDGNKGGVYTRLDVDKDGNAYILYQIGDAKLTGVSANIPSVSLRTIHLKKLSLQGNMINELKDIEIDGQCPEGPNRKTPGNIKIDSNGIAHLSWQTYCDDKPLRLVNYKAVDTKTENLTTVASKVIMGAMSNNSDMELDKNGNLHFIATTPQGTDGLAYRIMNKDSLQLSSLYYIYSPQKAPTSNVISGAANRFGEADTIGGALKEDTLGEIYLSFSGAGTDTFTYDPNSSRYCSEAAVAADKCYYYTAYYTKLKKDDLKTEPSGNSPLLTKFTPIRTVGSDQGTANSNPIIGKAWNQGVFMVFEDEYDEETKTINPLFNVYLKAVGGAVIGIPELKADFNCDSKIDLIDFGILLSYWNKKTTDGISNYINTQCNNKVKDLDLKKDGVIDGSDFAILFTCWGVPTESTCFK